MSISNILLPRVMKNWLCISLAHIQLYFLSCAAEDCDLWTVRSIHSLVKIPFNYIIHSPTICHIDNSTTCYFLSIFGIVKIGHNALLLSYLNQIFFPLITSWRLQHWNIFYSAILFIMWKHLQFSWQRFSFSLNPWFILCVHHILLWKLCNVWISLLHFLGVRQWETNFIRSVLFQMTLFPAEKPHM